jgi:hypothetical protein
VATGGFDIAITTLGHIYTMLSCQPTSPEALPHTYHADSRVSGISVGSHPVKVHPLRCPGPGCLAGLEACGCQPRGCTGPQCPRELDLRMETARSRLRSPHLGVVLVEVKLGGDTGPGLSPSQARGKFPRIDPVFVLRLGWVPRVPMSHGTNNYFWHKELADR